VKNTPTDRMRKVRARRRGGDLLVNPNETIDSRHDSTRRLNPSTTGCIWSSPSPARGCCAACWWCRTDSTAGRGPAGRWVSHPAPVLDRDLELVAVEETLFSSQPLDFAFNCESKSAHVSIHDLELHGAPPMAMTVAPSPRSRPRGPASCASLRGLPNSSP
jgi:hypothetical protein